MSEKSLSIFNHNNVLSLKRGRYKGYKIQESNLQLCYDCKTKKPKYVSQDYFLAIGLVPIISNWKIAYNLNLNLQNGEMKITNFLNNSCLMPEIWYRLLFEHKIKKEYPELLQDYPQITTFGIGNVHRKKLLELNPNLQNYKRI